MNKKISILVKVILFSFLLVTFINPAQAYIKADSKSEKKSKSDTASKGGTDKEGSADAEKGGLQVDNKQIVKSGKTLFNNNCKQCHNVSEQDKIGPGLKNVTQRRELPWLKSWIKNSAKMKAQGDEIAQQLYEEYDQEMPSFNFSDEKLTSILTYIKAKSMGKIGGDDGEKKAAGGKKVAAASGDEGVNSTTFNLILGIFLVVLVVLLLVLVLIINILTKYLKDNQQLDETERYVVNQKFDPGVILKSKAFKTTVIFVFIIVAGKYSLDGMVDIGVQQGYAPKQPISFSHKLHAGKYEINCEYCHTGVRKGKNANIPSPNICMNCHNQIRQESPQIQKIYKAVKYDKPIEWVRVHNLPDFAYFNHSQHVKVAGLECKQCHGPIRKMEVVQQYSPLTMGWCINCHRKTEVNAKGNDYYNKLKAVHEGEKLTVEKIGGLECAKCHY